MNLKKDTIVNLLILSIFPLGIIAVVVAPRIFDRTDEAKMVAAKHAIAYFDRALTEFYRDTARYPSTEEGLSILTRAKNKMGKTYVNRSIVDPWGIPYQYRCPGTHHTQSFDLWSYGADKVSGGQGWDRDITNWDNG
jgi:general secretion pathway protein G